MQVIVRVRPLSSEELRGPSRVLVQPSEDNQSLVIGESAYGTAVGSKTFRFTSVMPENASQHGVFEHVVPLLKSALDGFNCTVFTYGQTGTGETVAVVCGIVAERGCVRACVYMCS